MMLRTATRASGSHIGGAGEKLLDPAGAAGLRPFPDERVGVVSFFLGQSSLQVGSTHGAALAWQPRMRVAHWLPFLFGLLQVGVDGTSNEFGGCQAGLFGQGRQQLSLLLGEKKVRPDHVRILDTRQRSVNGSSCC